METEKCIYKIGSVKNPILIELKMFNGLKIIDIRKYYLSSDNSNNYLPTRKGISLSGVQLVEVLNLINQKTTDISRHFALDAIPETEVKYTNNFGRYFNVNYANNAVQIDINEDFARLIDETNLSFFVKILESLYHSLHQVLEEEMDVNLILESFNNRLRSHL
jgi:hypothetical protein